MMFVVIVAAICDCIQLSFICVWGRELNMTDSVYVGDVYTR